MLGAVALVTGGTVLNGATKWPHSAHSPRCTEPSPANATGAMVVDDLSHAGPDSFHLPHPHRKFVPAALGVTWTRTEWHHISLRVAARI